MRAVLSILSLAAVLVSASARAANYNRIMTCENGQVWIDVDADSRTQLQLVSRLSAANVRMSRDLHAYSRSEGGEYGSWETTWAGVQPRGVFSPSDFQGATGVVDFTSNTYPQFQNGSYIIGYKEYLSFFLISSDTLKLQITRTNITKCANNAYDGRFGSCTQGVVSSPDETTEGWVFHDCH